MRIGTIIETAMAWHGGMWSGLYSFGSTEKIHDDDHKGDMLAEIDECIHGEGMKESTMDEERAELYSLRKFVETAPIGVSLKYARIEDNGAYVDNPRDEVDAIVSAI